MEPAVSKKRQNKAAWFKSGFQLRGGWGRRPKDNAPDPRPPRWGLAGCCQLDPSHPTIVTCAVGREGRHAPRPNDVGGPSTFPRRQKGGDPAASGDLRLGHRAPGRGGRRASIPIRQTGLLHHHRKSMNIKELRIRTWVNASDCPARSYAQSVAPGAVSSLLQ